jgi:hypothetical protein
MNREERGKKNVWPVLRCHSNAFLIGWRKVKKKLIELYATGHDTIAKWET